MTSRSAKARAALLVGFSPAAGQQPQRGKTDGLEDGDGREQPNEGVGHVSRRTTSYRR